jgi:polysaccharide export outer membrane protein
MKGIYNIENERESTPRTTGQKGGLMMRPKTIFFALALLFLLAILSSNVDAFQETAPLVLNEYRIGAKDLLEITIFNMPELSQTVRVSEDGSVTFSILGKVEVAGLTAQELEKKMASLLDQQFTHNARVTVFIKEFQKVAVLGAVGRPGMYELVGPTTILQIISQAGGLTAQATKELYVLRQGKDSQKTRIAINLEDLTRGNQDLNILLQPKDEVIVPIDRLCNVFIYGEVRNPGAIPYLQSKGITLLQAIAQAGGTTEWAKKSRLLVKRKDKNTGIEMKIQVNLKNVISGKATDIILDEGDVIIVP